MVLPGGQSSVSSTGGDIVDKEGVPLCSGTGTSGERREREMIIIMPFLWSWRIKNCPFLLHRILFCISCLGLVMKAQWGKGGERLLVWQQVGGGK